MAYKVSGTASLKDDNTAVFRNVFVTTNHTTFGGIGVNATSGYNSGGSPPFSGTNVIQKYSFPSDANATDVGNLTATKFGTAGQSSSTNGYVSGGFVPSVSPTTANIIENFPFASDDNASDVGDLTKNRNRPFGQSLE